MSVSHYGVNILGLFHIKGSTFWVCLTLCGQHFGSVSYYGVNILGLFHITGQHCGSVWHYGVNILGLFHITGQHFGSVPHHGVNIVGLFHIVGLITVSIHVHCGAAADYGVRLIVTGRWVRTKYCLFMHSKYNIVFGIAPQLQKKHNMINLL